MAFPESTVPSRVGKVAFSLHLQRIFNEITSVEKMASRSTYLSSCLHSYTYIFFIVNSILCVQFWRTDLHCHAILIIREREKTKTTLAMAGMCLVTMLAPFPAPYKSIPNVTFIWKSRNKYWIPFCIWADERKVWCHFSHFQICKKKLIFPLYFFSVCWKTIQLFTTNSNRNF